MRLKPVNLSLALALSTALPAVGAEIADYVFKDGVIYTADKNREVVNALAVKGDKILSTGTEKDMADFIGPNTKVIDLQGKMVLPGLHDTHIHPTGLVEYENCDLESAPMTLAEISAHVSECITRLKPKEGEWIIGEQWAFSAGNQPGNGFENIRQALDAVSTVTPIVLFGNDGHHSAYNSAALAMAENSDGASVGLSKATLSTTFKDYEKLIGVDANGEPNGHVNEQARLLMPSPNMIDGNPEKVLENAEQIPRRLHSIGITSIRDAAYTENQRPVYDKLTKDGNLKLRVTLSQFHNPLTYLTENGTVNWNQLDSDVSRIKASFADTPNVKADSLKMFIDGVIEGNPLSNPPTLPNAAQLSPYHQPKFSFDADSHQLSITGYVDPAGKACQSSLEGDEFAGEFGFSKAQCTVSNGVLESPRDIELEFMRRYHDQGFVLHLHAIGDRAVRTAVDGIEAARAKHGNKGLPHGLAHIQMVHPDDISRIGAQKLTLAYTYAWITTDPEYDSTVVPFIDKIESIDELYNPNNYSFKQAYPTQSTLEAGALLVAGSDAPVDTRDPRPFINIQQALTRAGETGIAYNSSEKIGIYDILDAYTINGAKALQQDTITGSLETGKQADFIVIDQNLLSLSRSNPTIIGNTKVVETWFDGEQVYKQEQSRQ